MQVTYYGHSSVLLTINDTIVLIDPFITGNEASKHIDIKKINPDVILLTHGHQDHSLDVEAIAKQSGAVLVTNYEIANYYAEKGITTQAVNHGGTFSHKNFKAKYVNAIHTSSFPDGTYAGQPGGFVVYTDDKCIYHAGDTALTYDMKLIDEEFNVDLALLPIGGGFTMDAKDAAKAAKFVGCKHVVGIHYNTFPPITINFNEAKATFKEAGIKLTILEIEEELSI